MSNKQREFEVTFPFVYVNVLFVDDNDERIEMVSFARGSRFLLSGTIPHYYASEYDRFRPILMEKFSDCFTEVPFIAGSGDDYHMSRLHRVNSGLIARRTVRKIDGMYILK